MANEFLMWISLLLVLGPIAYIVGALADISRERKERERRRQIMERTIQSND